MKQNRNRQVLFRSSRAKFRHRIQLPQGLKRPNSRRHSPLGPIPESPLRRPPGGPPSCCPSCSRGRPGRSSDRCLPHCPDNCCPGYFARCLPGCLQNRCPSCSISCFRDCSDHSAPGRRPRCSPRCSSDCLADCPRVCSGCSSGDSSVSCLLGHSVPRSASSVRADRQHSGHFPQQVDEPGVVDLNALDRTHRLRSLGVVIEFLHLLLVRLQ